MALKYPFRFGLRASLVLLVLICMLPAILYTALWAQDEMSARVKEVQEEMLALVASTADDIQSMTDSSQMLLMTLAQLPIVRQKDTPACDAFFAELLKQHPLYSNIAAGDAKGDNFGNGVPITRPLSMADRAYFQRAMATSNFAVGAFQYSRSTGVATIVFAYPFYNDRGGSAGVVVCGLNLTRVSTALAGSLPDGGTILVVDADGTVLLRHPDPEKWVGQSLAEAPIVSTMLTVRSGTAEVPGVDGIPRLYGFGPLPALGNQVYLSIGVPSAAVYAPVDALLRWRLTWLGVVTALALIAAWGFGHLMITRRVGRLATAAKKVTAGDLTTRVHPRYQRDEIDSLALDFDIMSDELQKNRDHLEDLVKQRTTQLEEANKEMEAFTYSVSHDLRSPLRAIDGFSRILLEDYADKLDSEGKRLFGVVRDNTMKMGRLIDDLLTLSRVGRREMTCTRVDMTLLVREVTDEIKTANPGRSLEFTVGDLPPAYGDRALLRQVLANLLDNAAKFTRPRQTAIIEVGGRPDGSENIYWVKDNGVGFDMKYADKLFGVFQRLHRTEDFEGTGVGLGIVQRVIRRHGGRVWAEGVVDGGATFYFSLPIGDTAGGPESAKT